ncbi:hypothetical protein CY652_23030 [Burkholderia sp. WAC0059]|nr:hypothetical protein CY652_23030 [Burkholderia sp. WAC0059]
MERGAYDFPSEDPPYTFAKLKRRSIVVRLFFGAGLRKLENDYLNPKHGDVLASQRRYRRYLAGDRRVVVEASMAEWGPLLTAVTPFLIMGAALLYFSARHALAPYIVPAEQTIERLTGYHFAAPVTPTATPAANPVPSTPPAPQAVAPAETAGPGNGDSQDQQAGQDLSVKVQALLAQAEQQFDAGQYQDAAATAEAIQEIDPGNVGAQRLREAALRNLATEQAADEAQRVQPAPPPPGMQATPYPVPAPAPYHPPVEAHHEFAYGRHAGGR